MLFVSEDLRSLGVTDIVAIDTEFVPRRGERVNPVCVCGKSLVHGKEWQLFNDGSGQPCPLSDAPETLFVAFGASAEWGFYFAMGCPISSYLSIRPPILPAHPRCLKNMHPRSRAPGVHI